VTEAAAQAILKNFDMKNKRENEKVLKML